MILTQEQQAILNGEKGATLRKNLTHDTTWKPTVTSRTLASTRSCTTHCMGEQKGVGAK